MCVSLLPASVSNKTTHAYTSKNIENIYINTSDPRSPYDYTGRLMYVFRIIIKPTTPQHTSLLTIIKAW